MPTVYARLQKWVVTLRFTILFLFSILFLLVIFIFISLMTSLFFDSISYTALGLMRASTQSIVNKISESLRPVEVESNLAGHLITSGILQPTEEDLQTYNYYLVKTIPLVQSAFWGDEHGLIVLAEKSADHSIMTSIYHLDKKPNTLRTIYRNLHGDIIKETITTGTFHDPRIQGWYKNAEHNKTTTWSGVFQYLYYPFTLGTGTVTPAYDKQGNFIGEFGLALTLNDLSNFLSAQPIRKHGFSFIVDKQENLIAYPKRKPFINHNLNSNQMISVHHGPLKLIDMSLDTYKKNNKHDFVFEYENKKYLASYAPVPELADHGWLIGTLVPEDDFISELKHRFILILLFSLLIAVISIFIISELVKRIVHPINQLIVETDKIRQFELDKPIKIDSRIKEVINLRSAMESMRVGLKSFQKYVPKSLVQQLIATGLDMKIGGERKEIVIFFSDIINFTTIAEHVESNQLLTQICAYFEKISSIIINNQGTIDKYIGDSVMAFWGAPQQDVDPWGKAVKTAWECEQALRILNEEWKAEGKPVFKTRIGIHSGEALVGNVGSSWRLNYTVLGDAVNVASRLEQINKIYHTEVMVSRQVYEKTKDRFQFRLIDYIILKGRESGDTIYELLGEKGEKLSFDLTQYREKFMQGFAHYQAREWGQAIVYFKQCLQIYPQDLLVPIFIARCEDAMVGLE